MATIYVKYNATGSNNGSSWTNAYTNLQSGITAALSGTSDQIWVAAGTYYPTTQVGGGGSQFNAFTMKSGIAIYGGFNGTETGLTQRDYTTNIVILNGGGCYHVFNNTDLTLTSTSILDGFTISGGTASGTTYNFGGGIFNYTTTSAKTNTSIIRNCRFTNNFSNDSGGAIYNSQYHSPTIYNCSFDNNTTYYLGGAICNIRDEEGRHGRRIKLPPRTPDNLAARGFFAHGRAVAAHGPHGMVGIDDGKNAGANADLVALQP